MDRPFLPYCRPFVDEREAASLTTSLANGWLTTGPKVAEFEAAFAQACGVKHAVALNSCTAALHIGLAALGVGPGDEVVTPSLTFVAGAQCARELGATPVFCDVDPQTLSATPASIEAVVTPRTKAIVAMPYGGRPQGIREIVAFAQSRGIPVLEDAAHGAGMLDEGSWAGTHSAAAAYSFYATKNLTTAEGGMLVTNDEALADRARVLSLHGMNRDAWKRYTARGSWRYDVVEPGYKYNMPDIAASMGLVQLARLDEMQARRRELAARYIDALGAIPGITVQRAPERPGDVHAWCMFVVRVDEKRAGISRDGLIDALKDDGIGTSVHYIPTHLFSGYRALKADVPATDAVWTELISLPLYPGMSDADVDRVCESIARHCVSGSLARSTADIAAV